MTEKRFKLFVGNNYGVQKVDGEVIFDSISSIAEADVLVDLLNDLTEENEQLKKDRFICLDCKHSGYTEIGCLCEKEDHWTDYKTECEDYEELEYDW